MPTPAAFGRRSSIVRPTAPIGEPLALSADAEAFRRKLASQADPQVAGFAQWRKEQRASRGLAWIATFILLTPGVICFMAAAPWPVSAALEAVGLASGWWLRRARRRHIEAIIRWTPEGGDA